MKRIESKHVIYKFMNGLEAIAKVDNGESFTVKTNDCFFQQLKSNNDLIEHIDFNKVNPATGPIFIEDAEIGDILKLEILDIRVENEGVIVVSPGMGALPEQAQEALTRIIPIVDGQVDFLGIKAEIDPMIGVIGVSPGKDQEGVLTAIPHNHGGNMDTTDIRKGATLYFPIREKGAMLALGDCHAIMGDGEICVSGMEIPAEVDLKATIIKNKKIDWPLLENEKEIMVIASGETLQSALKAAATELTRHVEKSLGILWEEAYMFNSLFVDYKISQAVNANKTVRAVVKKEILDIEMILEKL